jgi:acetylornithine/N-succinyldiaminopimelate aminotransferase
LLILQAGPDVLRLVPPLTIATADVEEGLRRLRATLTAFGAA